MEAGGKALEERCRLHLGGGVGSWRGFGGRVSIKRAVRRGRYAKTDSFVGRLVELGVIEVRR